MDRSSQYSADLSLIVSCRLHSTVVYIALEAPKMSKPWVRFPRESVRAYQKSWQLSAIARSSRRSRGSSHGRRDAACGPASLDTGSFVQSSSNPVQAKAEL